MRSDEPHELSPLIEDKQENQNNTSTNETAKTNSPTDETKKTNPSTDPNNSDDKPDPEDPKTKILAATTQAEVWSDSQDIGWEFFASIFIGVALMVAFNLAIQVLFTWVFQGIMPITQISECPSNANDFGESAVFYEGCVDKTSSMYNKYNVPPANTTFSAKGWFYTEEWSRDSIRKNQRGSTINEDEVVEAVYECPIFQPFWQCPVDWLGIVFLIVTNLLVAYYIATCTIRKNTIYEDRVEVTYIGGGRVAVPLSSIKGEAEAHELAGCPPLRPCALALKSTEKLLLSEEYGVPYGNVVSTLIKKEDEVDEEEMTLRVEPQDVEAFQAALAKARKNAPLKATFFEDEMPKIPHSSTVATSDSTGSDNQTFSYTPSPYRCGYLVRSLILLAIYWVIAEFGFKLTMYGLQEALQPDRPKTDNEFGKSVLTIHEDEVFVTVLVVLLAFGKSLLAGVPTKVLVSADALIVKLDRAKRLCKASCGFWQDAQTLVVPKAAVAAVVPGSEMDCCTQACNFPFDEMGGHYISAAVTYTVTKTKQKVVVVRKCADPAKKDEEKEMPQVAVDKFHCFYPDDPEKLKSALNK
jgi:hypothetical protein